MHIDIFDESNLVPSNMVALLRKSLRYAAEKEDLKEAEMSLSFVHDEQIQALNAEYRQINAPTDVLTFAMQNNTQEEEIMHDQEHLSPILGDIIISFDRAKEQAKAYGHSLEREMGFLTIHGFLHLLGYHHEEPKAEKVMFQRQEEILKEFDLER